MILADKIIDLRKKAGWSQEELAEKLGVSRQSVSKWEGAQSIPDMNKILQLSELFGVSTDYLLKDSLEAPEPVAAPAEDTDTEGATFVSMEEANAFLSYKAESAPRIALGVLLCILSPITLTIVCGAQETGRLALTEMQAAMIGLMVLVLMVAGAVLLFVLTGMKGKNTSTWRRTPWTQPTASPAWSGSASSGRRAITPAASPWAWSSVCWRPSPCLHSSSGGARTISTASWA